jgi:hypothetical protein
VLPVLETLVLAPGLPLAYQTRPALHGVSQQHAGAFDESVRLFAPSRSPDSGDNLPHSTWRRRLPSLRRACSPDGSSEETPTHCSMTLCSASSPTWRPSQTLTDPLPFRQTVKNPWTLFGLGTAVNRFTRLHTTSPVTGGHTLLRSGEVWLIALASHLAHYRTRQHHDSRQHHGPASPIAARLINDPAPSANFHCFAFTTLDLQSGHIGSMQLG